MKKEKFSSIAPLTEAVNHKLISHLGAISSQCERFLLGLEEGVYKNKTDKELIQKATEIMRINLNATSSCQNIIRGISSYIEDMREGYTRDIDIKESINKALSFLKNEIKGSGAEIKKGFPKRLSKIKANSLEVQELFFIIIKNAIEAIREKGKGSVFIKVLENKREIFVEIKDTGSGMSQQVLKRIFEPLFTTKSDSGRNGLGLFIAHEIIYSLNGSITCESSLGRGSSFHLRFPK